MTDATVIATPKKRKLAEHDYLDAQGSVVEDESNATGIRYFHLVTQAEFTYQVPGAVAGTPQTMLAVCGAKTLATNEASQIKQKHGPSADPVPNIRARFTGIDAGIWVERDRVVVDLDKLAQAWIDSMVNDGRAAPDFTAARALLDSKDNVKTVRSNTAVVARYTELMGRGKSLDDLAALLGAAPAAPPAA